MSIGAPLALEKAFDVKKAETGTQILISPYFDFDGYGSAHPPKISPTDPLNSFEMNATCFQVNDDDIKSDYS